MSRNLRNLPVRLDPNDHGYYVDGSDAEPGELVLERDPEQRIEWTCRACYGAIRMGAVRCGDLSRDDRAWCPRCQRYVLNDAASSISRVVR